MAPRPPHTVICELTLCMRVTHQVVQNTATMGLTNEGVAPVSFTVCRAVDESSREGEAGVPSWLEVYPLDGVLASKVGV